MYHQILSVSMSVKERSVGVAFDDKESSCSSDENLRLVKPAPGQSGCVTPLVVDDNGRLAVGRHRQFRILVTLEQSHAAPRAAPLDGPR